MADSPEERADRLLQAIAESDGVHSAAVCERVLVPLVAAELRALPAHIRCDECKHWGEFSLCQAAQHPAWSGTPEDAPMVLVEPGALRTRPDFGCRLWEPRDG